MSRALALFVVCIALAACAHTSVPTKNGEPDGAVYPQTKAQCEAQPNSPWCQK